MATTNFKELRAASSEIEAVSNQLHGLAEGLEHFAGSMPFDEANLSNELLTVCNAATTTARSLKMEADLLSSKSFEIREFTESFAGSGVNLAAGESGSTRFIVNFTAIKECLTDFAKEASNEVGDPTLSYPIQTARTLSGDLLAMRSAIDGLLRASEAASVPA
jgi:hypothetical protein